MVYGARAWRRARRPPGAHRADGGALAALSGTYPPGPSSCARVLWPAWRRRRRRVCGRSARCCSACWSMAGCWSLPRVGSTPAGWSRHVAVGQQPRLVPVRPVAVACCSWARRLDGRARVELRVLPGWASARSRGDQPAGPAAPLFPLELLRRGDEFRASGSGSRPARPAGPLLSCSSCCGRRPDGPARSGGTRAAGPVRGARPQRPQHRGASLVLVPAWPPVRPASARGGRAVPGRARDVALPWRRSCSACRRSDPDVDLAPTRWAGVAGGACASTTGWSPPTTSATTSRRATGPRRRLPRRPGRHVPGGGDRRLPRAGAGRGGRAGGPRPPRGGGRPSGGAAGSACERDAGCRIRGWRWVVFVPAERVGRRTHRRGAPREGGWSSV